VKPPSAGGLNVQVQAARLGAREEKICTARAPSPAANAFDIMVDDG